MKTSLKKLPVVLLLLLLATVAPLCAISFGYSVFDIGGNAEFASGTFPLYVDYGFNFPLPDFISGNNTVLRFSLRNGLVSRTLRQNPETGVPYAMTGLPDYPTKYTVLMDEFELSFGQGFGKTSLSAEDSVTLLLAFGGRFENAYERLSWAHTPDDLEALFMKREGGERVARFSSFSGVPELAGNRSVFTGFLLAGLDFDFMTDNVITRNGAKLEFRGRWCPSWLFWGDGSAEYFRLSGELNLGFTIFALRHDDHPYLSLVMDNSTYYRYLSGSKVPVFIQSGGIWGVEAENLTHYVSNRLNLTLYVAPIPKIDNVYLSCTGFLDVGYGRGRLLNTSDATTYSNPVASGGVRFTAMLFSILEAYYELGYIIDNSFNLPADSSFQVKFGLRLTV